MAKPLALTSGEPAGVGPDIAIEAWLRRSEASLPPFYLLGDRAFFADRARHIGLNADFAEVDVDEAAAAFTKALPVVATGKQATAAPGRPDGSSADAVIASIRQAVGDVTAGRASAVVTNPIAKSVLYRAGFKHPGHTEFLAELASRDGKTPQPVMMLWSPTLAVVPVTIHLPLRDAIDFYRHERGWANRLVAGDSLLVMNSLLQKESMAGRVQMIYIDPPYGIKYGSNFQPFVGKRDVKDRNDADLTQEPEMIKAFRDTWELGIHSYLTYLRDRLLLARELLHESGSVFVQISDENLHHVREILDDTFGQRNFVAQIHFKKTGGLDQSVISVNYDHIAWYSKSKSKLKYRQLFFDRLTEELTAFRYLFFGGGAVFTEASTKKTHHDTARKCQSVSLTSQGSSAN